MKYSNQEKQFLIENISSVQTFRELSNALNSEFGTNRTTEQVRDQCIKQLRIKIGKNAGRYGDRPKEQLPIGTIRKSANHCTYIKVLDSTQGHFTGYKEPWWKPLQKKLYEDAYGPVGDKLVVFLDCNRENFNLNNLYAVDKKITTRLAKNGWWSTNPDITLAGIKLCELIEALK